MKQQIRFLIRMVRTYPRYAVMAISLDAALGLIAAATTYVLLTSTNVSPSTQGVLIFSGLLAVAGILGVGYTLLKNRLGIDGDYDGWMEDPYDEDHANDDMGG